MMPQHSFPTVRLRPDADRRVRAGHLWVFSNELQDGFQQLPPGELVELLDATGRSLGVGTVNPHSLIAVRILTRHTEVINEEFIGRRILAALKLRQQVVGTDEYCYRLIFSEADGLPGLIVDRFNDVFVVQSLSAGVEQLLDLVLLSLKAALNPRAIVLANDSPMRELEGLSLKRELAFGTLDSQLGFEQDGITLLAELIAGQKTGFFFDQRRNRQLVQRFLPRDAAVLDLFCYTGAFGLYVLQAGASHVTFVDDSAAALRLAKEAVAANGWDSRATYLEQDIFPSLSSVTETYDMVIVDPPALAKSRAKVGSALRAYRDLNARAMARVRSGGVLASSSCSGLVEPAAWRQALRDAAHKAGKRLRIIAQGSQAPDHPILVSMPETEYLKFLVAVVD